MAIIKVPFMSFERGAVVFAASASMSPRSRRTRACVCAPKRSRLRARARAYINQPAAEDGLFGVQSPALMFMLATARAKCSLPIKKPVIRLIEARKRGPRSCGSHFGCVQLFFFFWAGGAIGNRGVIIAEPVSTFVLRPSRLSIKPHVAPAKSHIILITEPQLCVASGIHATAPRPPQFACGHTYANTRFNRDRTYTLAGARARAQTYTNTGAEPHTHTQLCWMVRSHAWALAFRR